jgi:hypothetical protein
MGRIDSKPLKIGRVSHLAGIEKQIWLGASVNNGRPGLFRRLAFLVNQAETSVCALMHGTIVLHIDRAQDVLEMVSTSSSICELTHFH